MFDEVKNESFDQREENVLSFWNAERIFEKSVEERQHQPLFSFYDGPPFATGLPHYGHFLAGTIKDVVLRYKTMKGFHVPRRFGWDCHGLPVENEIEKAHNLAGAVSIEQFGIANFNEACRSIVLRYTNEWKSIVQRMGRWVSFDQTYHTMDLPFMESVWWAFKQLFEKGLVYEGYKVMPFSAKLGTPLSNFEAGENYREVDDPSLTVAFTLNDRPNTAILAWTTTPWTLVSNLALLVRPDVDYVTIRTNEASVDYILAEARLGATFKPDTYTVIKTEKGESLLGLTYQPLLPYFKEEAAKGAFRIIPEESLSTDDGTGVVHCAPAFGEVDFYAAQRAGIELVCPVDSNGRFTADIAEYQGQFVKDADKEIIKRLKTAGQVIYHGTIHHRYPFCWRSDTPLIYKVVSTWFVAVETFRDALVASNEQIHWTPDHLKHGRFGKWLDGARDWAISRNRYWGTPLPLWRSEDGDIIVIGSIQELEESTGAKITDLHRHFIDDLTIERNGKTYRRIPEVFDCWFESGSMPYAQNHYPFENKEAFQEMFPADFIGEGLDQTRGWFYTLTILSTALFGKPAFKNVIVNGIVLAADGAKMSKRLRNYPDPVDLIKKCGADAIRLYMMHSPAVRGDDLCFKETGVEIVMRQVLIPLWNAYSFFITYARIYNWKPSKNYPQPDATIDKWMLSLLNKLISDVESGFDDYDLSRAVEPFVGFVEQLTNWYIRRSRRRFWNDQASPDRDQAFATLYRVLIELVKIAAPVVPFITDAIYQNLRSEDMPASVHLCDFPAYHLESRDLALEEAMAAVQTTVSLGHALRKEHKLKVRQPLATAHVASGDPTVYKFLNDQKHLIADELNVKEVTVGHDETELVSLRAKPNFRVLGKKVGKHMPAIQKIVDGFDQHQLSMLKMGGQVVITVEGEEFSLSSEDIQVDRSVREGLIAANEGLITIALSTELTEPLLIEGLAREIVNKINTMRREADLNVSDRIAIRFESSERVRQAYDSFRDYIDGEVLAVRVEFGPCEGAAWDLNGEEAKIEISVS